MVDADDAPDDDAVADDVEADELVVVPGVVLGRLVVGVLIDPEDRLDEALGGRAVVDAVEEADGVAVHPAELAHRRGACRATASDSGTCSVNVGARHEAPLGVVGVQLELDGALEAVRLDEAADPQLRLPGRACVRPRQSSVATSTRTRVPSASAVMSVRSAFAVRPPRPMTRPRSSGCT